MIEKREGKGGRVLRGGWRFVRCYPRLKKISGYLSNLIRILLREISKKSNKKRAMYYDSFHANCYRSIVTRVVNSTDRNGSMIFLISNKLYIPLAIFATRSQITSKFSAFPTFPFHRIYRILEQSLPMEILKTRGYKRRNTSILFTRMQKVGRNSVGRQWNTGPLIDE